MNTSIGDMYLEIMTCMICFVSYYETSIFSVQGVYPDSAVFVWRRSCYLYIKYIARWCCQTVKWFSLH